MKVQLDGHDDLPCCSTRFELCEGLRRRLEPVEDIIFDDGFELAVISQLSKLLRTNKLSTVCTHARTHARMKAITAWSVHASCIMLTVTTTPATAHAHKAGTAGTRCSGCTRCSAGRSIAKPVECAEYPKYPKDQRHLSSGGQGCLTSRSSRFGLRKSPAKLTPSPAAWLYSERELSQRNVPTIKPASMPTSFSTSELKP